MRDQPPASQNLPAPLYGDRSFLGVIRDAVMRFKRRMNYSNESLFSTCVQAHARIAGPRITNIVFAAPSEDVFTQWKVNAERHVRWLDDDSKSTNLLPINYLPSLLLGLPLSERAALLDELFRPLGVSVRPMTAEGCVQALNDLLATMMKEGAEAQQALLQCLVNADRETLIKARRELVEGIAAMQVALEQIESRLSGGEA